MGSALLSASCTPKEEQQGQSAGSSTSRHHRGQPGLCQDLLCLVERENRKQKPKGVVPLIVFSSTKSKASLQLSLLNTALTILLTAKTTPLTSF